MSTERTTVFLMANLGSEISRILEWKEKGDEENTLQCVERARSILSEINGRPEMLSRAQEINILGRIVDDALVDKSAYDIRAEDLKSYFYPFALRVLSERKYV